MDRKEQFIIARDYVRSLHLSRTDWKRWINGKAKHFGPVPDFVSSEPYFYFRYSGWVSMEDWLGETPLLSFEEARAFVRTLGLSFASQWRKYCAGKLIDLPLKPVNIPDYPNKVYSSEFIDFPDFLGCSKEYLPFDKAREYIHSLGLNGRNEFIKMHKGGKLPETIPLDAIGIYKDDWVGWGDFVGSGRIRCAKNKDECNWMGYEEAKKIVSKLNLSSISAWRLYIKDGGAIPFGIPKNPQMVYKKVFLGWQDWLGNNAEKFLPFEEAREYMHKLGLSSYSEWRPWRKSSRPVFIPSNPHCVYKNQWLGWPNFLGYAPLRRSKLWSFEEARAFAHKLGLSSYPEWKAWRKATALESLPVYPPYQYPQEWKGWSDFLGKETLADMRNGVDTNGN